ncbi:hypothetical protein PG997_014139 [Apiospora hydei]|uniref:Cyclochlorotine biosynthesis protein O n=1 Tax=Apiospora hydei TaxID=1337664 RepID=A0ABR1V889_9PEZI
MPGVFSKRYSKVEQLDDSAELPPTEHEARLRKVNYLPWLLHLVLLASYSTFVVIARVKGTSCSPCFSESLIGAPIAWEERTFSTNRYINGSDPYSRENPNVDSAWAEPIDNIIIVISEEEKQRLPGERDTARAYGEPRGYAVSIEMFHQLHCLNYLRKAYFEDGPDRLSDPERHADHCFSYLYQTLLCHADVGVMTMRVDEEFNIFQPEFNVTKQCRDHKLIRAWQRSRKSEFQVPP